VKILLDECLPHNFRRCIAGHDVHTAEFAGFKGKKNGALLSAADVAGYQVLITLDQGMIHQQSLAGRRIAILLLRATSNDLEDLEPLVGAILECLKRIGPGEVLIVKN
jgi:predicted nuclease of predicted toxin-antitoxin system